MGELKIDSPCGSCFLDEELVCAQCRAYLIVTRARRSEDLAEIHAAESNIVVREEG